MIEIIIPQLQQSSLYSILSGASICFILIGDKHQRLFTILEDSTILSSSPNETPEPQNPTTIITPEIPDLD
eukprot:EST42298.1 Hypothetical protein SS50377_18167 [Spironucleus salmonicida]